MKALGRVGFELRVALGLLVALGTAPACNGTVTDPGTGPGEVGGPAPPQSSQYATGSGARRLTRAELDNTLRDLLGDESSPASRLLTEEEFTPYDNDYTGQMASEALINELEALAADVGRRVTSDPALRDAVVPCTPNGPGDAGCFRSFVASFVPRALRRPVEEGEIDAYMTLQAYATEDNPHVDNDFYTAVDLVIRAVVQDPEFLYRIEVGAPTEHDFVFALSGEEIATRMSYLLWGSTPDDPLLAAAAAGDLATSEGRRMQATRMLTDDRARAQLHRFHAMWLGYRAIPHDQALVSAFDRETSALLDRVVFEEGRSYLDVFRLEETFVDDALADHYGLARPAGGQGWVPYGDSGRAGVLSHGSVLSAFSKFTDTSPTQRGILVRSRLMCLDIPQPPPTVDVDQPPGEGSDGCKAERYAEHTQGSCAGCHLPIDNIGFGLERYDIGGRFREHDEGRPDCVIEGVGEYPGAGSFSGPGELSARLVEDGSIESCFVEHFYSYAIGRAVDDVEAPVVEELVASFAGAGHDLRTFLAELVADERFALRREEGL
jgi:hypothetical protein